MAQEAVTNAVKDAGISYKDFEQAFVGYVYGIDNDLQFVRTIEFLFVFFSC